MARPRKIGLDYFPLDVNFFSDKKIRRLKAKYGTDGIAVYIYLLCAMYRDKGYYIEYDNDLILDISDDLSISENSTRQILKYLVDRSLLQEIKCSTLVGSVTVITAESVQRRFQEVKKSCKRDVVVEARFWILKKSETYGLIKVRPNSGFSEKNDSFSEKNEDYSEKNSTKESKGKESKVNESKENESKENESKENGSKENESGAAAPTGSGWEPSPTAACRPAYRRHTNSHTDAEQVSDLIAAPCTETMYSARGRTPTLDEVKSYIDMKGYRTFTAERFCSYYGAVGWKRNNGTPITNWKALADSWEMNSLPQYIKDEQRSSFDVDDLEQLTRFNN